MIIACPACTTRYVVADSAIGVDGRTVRCAKCRHSWFQEGPPIARESGVKPAPPPHSPTEPATAAANEAPGIVDSPSPAETAAPPPRASHAEPPIPEPAAPVRVYADGDDGRYVDEGRSSFDFAPPFRPRRNRLRMWTLATLLFAVVALGAVVAVASYGLPNWMPFARSTFAQAQPDLVLDFPPNRQDRRTLPNGTEFFGASGTVTNIGQTRRAVPTILIVLRDAREKIVYTWEVVPPKRQLAPGETITINEAVTDVPRTARAAEIGWKPG